MGFRWANINSTVLAVLLPEHGRHHICGRFGRHGTHAHRPRRVGGNARRGRAAGVHPPRLCQQAGSEGGAQRPAGQRRPRPARGPESAVVHTGDQRPPGQGTVRGLRLARHMHQGRRGGELKLNSNTTRCIIFFGFQQIKSCFMR